MTEITDGVTAQTEAERFDQLNDLSPIEHTLIGSTVKVNGINTDSDTIIPMMKEGPLDDAFFIPFSQKEFPKNTESLNKRRETQKFVKGMMGFVDTDSFINLNEKGLTPCLSLPVVNISTGKVAPRWELFLYDSNKKSVSDDIEALDLLILEPGYAKGFEIIKGDDGKRVLVTKEPIK